MDQTRKRHRNMDIFGDIEEAQPYELLAAGVNTRIDEFDAAEKSQVSKKRKKGRRRETESASNKTAAGRSYETGGVSLDSTASCGMETPSRPAQAGSRSIKKPEQSRSELRRESPSPSLSFPDNSFSMAVDSDSSHHELPSTRSNQINCLKTHSATINSPLEEDKDSDCFDKPSSAEEESEPRHSPPRRSSHKRKRASKTETVLTTVTPIVHSLIASFFDIEFRVVGDMPTFLDEEMLSREQPTDQSTLAGDEIKYEAGDFVMLNKGDHEDNSLLRFAQILFFDRRNKQFHARWFIHGSQTILGELAHGQELFLSIADECENVPVDCLVAKCKVVRISLEQRANFKWPREDTYFYSSSWDRNNPVDFTEVRDEQVELPNFRVCKRCQARETSSSHFETNTKSVIQSREYHEYDFICYRAAVPAQLTCSIGQIIIFVDSEDGVQVKVSRLGRMRDRTGPGHFTESELFLTSVEETLNANDVLGPCQVRHVSEFESQLMDRPWLDQHPWTFYLQFRAASLNSPFTRLLPTELPTCPICDQEQAELARKLTQCREEISLCAFDPFAGVGGFGLGLARGCSMRTTHAVELNASAAETMRRNFPPETTVFTADANRILRHIVQGRAGVPHPGQIDLIYTGPPCQNDSTLNIHKNDRKCLAFTALSFVDVLRPLVFVMESVPGFLQQKMQGTAHEIKAGHLKLVIKVLHFLGYNVAGRLLHARSFGVPQLRNRFFIVATQSRLEQFKFPNPTHSFRPGQQFRSLERLGPGLKLISEIAPGCAPHEVVTVGEALSDLPPFDWKCPKKPTTQLQRKAAADRAELIPSIPCDPDAEWGIQDEAFKYVTPNVNAYQQRARWDLALCADKQYQHFTKHFPRDVVQNVCDIPLARGADYRHLDQQNRPWSLRDPASASAIGGFQAGAYTRLNPDGYFQTVVTNVGPMAKQAAVIHPFCKRVITVRELARAQGFPDDFVFYSETDRIADYHLQIGNSVPFGVSAALGRSLQDLVFRKWQSHSESQAISEAA